MQTLALSTPMAGRLDVNTNVVITGYSCDNTPEIEQSRSLHETPVAGHTGHGTIGPVEPNNAKQISCFASSCVVSRVSRAHLANDVHDRVDLPFISSSSTSSTFSTLDNPSSSSNDTPIRRRVRPWRPHPHPRPHRRPRSPSPSLRLHPTLLQTTPPLSSRQTAKKDAGSCWRGQSSQRCVAFSSSASLLSVAAVRGSGPLPSARGGGTRPTLQRLIPPSRLPTLAPIASTQLHPRPLPCRVAWCAAQLTSAIVRRSASHIAPDKLPRSYFAPSHISSLVSFLLPP